MILCGLCLTVLTFPCRHFKVPLENVKYLALGCIDKVLTLPRQLNVIGTGEELFGDISNAYFKLVKLLCDLEGLPLKVSNVQAILWSFPHFQIPEDTRCPG